MFPLLRGSVRAESSCCDQQVVGAWLLDIEQLAKRRQILLKDAYFLGS
jgi:hypothetical protein